MAAVFALACLSLLCSGPDDIDEWIRRLGDPDVAVRNRAGAELDRLSFDLIAGLHLLASAARPADGDELRRRERIREGWRSALQEFLPPGPQAVRPVKFSSDDENRCVRRSLRTQRLTIDISNAPLTAILDLLREKTGLNIHLLDEGRSDDLMISVKARDENGDSLFRRLLKPLAMTYTIQDGVLLIIPAGRLAKRARLELYDVQDLTFEQTGEELVEKIVQEIRPDQWEADSGRSIQFQNGLLIVRTTAAIHDEIRSFIDARWRSFKRPAPPRDSVLAAVRGLAGPARDEAERRLSDLGREVAHALSALSSAGTSEDLEVRLRASTLSGAVTRALGDEPTRCFLEVAELQGLVREIRALWTHDTDFEDFEAEVRSTFGSRAAWVQVAAPAKEGDDQFPGPLAKAVWSGDSAVFFEEGVARVPTREDWLDPRGKLFVFTLPQDPEERWGDEGPCCVLVKFAP